MLEYSLNLPFDFIDYEWEVAEKGYFSDAYLEVGNARYRINFYDIHRFTQEVEDELNKASMFFEENLVFVHKVNRENMELAVKSLVQFGRIDFLKVWRETGVGK